MSARACQWALGATPETSVKAFDAFIFQRWRPQNFPKMAMHWMREHVRSWSVLSTFACLDSVGVLSEVPWVALDGGSNVYVIV